MSETNPKTEVRTVRLEKPLLKRLEEIAEQEDRSVSYLLRKAIEEFVDRHTKKK
jgi:predicted transcriptional regulator